MSGADGCQISITIIPYLTALCTYMRYTGQSLVSSKRPLMQVLLPSCSVVLVPATICSPLLPSASLCFPLLPLRSRLLAVHSKVTEVQMTHKVFSYPLSSSHTTHCPLITMPLKKGRSKKTKHETDSNQMNKRLCPSLMSLSRKHVPLILILLNISQAFQLSELLSQWCSAFSRTLCCN